MPTGELSEPFRQALAARYDLVREHGRGGMATVWLARDLRHDRPVALKIVRPDLAHVLGAERFQRETRLAARLQHPHILPVLDSGEADGRLWFTMPFVEGESLRDRLRREPQLPVQEAVRLAREAAQALQHAHEHGVIHRDVKPENLLLTRDGSLLVADFGLAMEGGPATDARLTGTGLSVGTPAYMSPEQAAGQRTLDARTDVYSLATVLHEMLAGEPPYTGANTQALLMKRLAGPVPSVRTVRPVVPEGIASTIRMALSPVAADRFGSMAAFAAALQDASGVTATVIAPSAPSARSRWGRLVAAAMLVILAVGTLLALRGLRARVEPSVAVLPFVNMGADSADGYFSDGLTEEIITRLGALPGLKVISRTSAMHYKGSTAPLREIAGELDVAHVLEGSVRRADGRLRITAQLVDARADEPVWAATYDHAPRDAFEVQETIAREVAQALEVELEEPGQRALTRKGTLHPEAEDLYRRARYLWATRSREGQEQALAYLHQAIARDSGYADAWAAIADVYLTTHRFGWSELSEQEAYGRVKASAERALALDPRSADAHAAYSQVLWWQRDWPGAERELRRAIELNPGNASARGWYALLLIGSGRTEEALRESRRAAELDPFALIVSLTYAWGCYIARDYECSVEQLRRTLEINPSWPITHVRLGESYTQQNRHEEAARAVTAALENGAPWLLADLAYVRARAGRASEARRLLDSARTISPSFNVARAYAALGEADSAFAWLERANWLWAGTGAVRADPGLDPVRDDPRFAALSGRVDRDLGLVER